MKAVTASEGFVHDKMVCSLSLSLDKLPISNNFLLLDSYIRLALGPCDATRGVDASTNEGLTNYSLLLDTQASRQKSH